MSTVVENSLKASSFLLQRLWMKTLILLNSNQSVSYKWVMIFQRMNYFTGDINCKWIFKLGAHRLIISSLPLIYFSSSIPFKKELVDPLIWLSTSILSKMVSRRQINKERGKMLKERKINIYCAILYFSSDHSVNDQNEISSEAISLSSGWSNEQLQSDQVGKISTR